VIVVTDQACEHTFYLISTLHPFVNIGEDLSFLDVEMAQDNGLEAF